MITCPAFRDSASAVPGDSDRASGSLAVRSVELKLLCLILIALFASGGTVLIARSWVAPQRVAAAPAPAVAPLKRRRLKILMLETRIKDG